MVTGNVRGHCKGKGNRSRGIEDNEIQQVIKEIVRERTKKILSLSMHKGLAQGRWFTLSAMEQLGNIGSEVSRALNAQEKGDHEAMTYAMYRALDLIDLTVEDTKWRTHRLKELLRMREVLCDYFFGDNVYAVTQDMWRKDFLFYGYAARALSRKK